MARYWVLRAAALVVPRVPIWLARPLAELLGLVAWACAGGMRARVERNLRHVPSLAGEPRRRRRAVRGVFRHVALNYLDFLRGRTLSEEQVRNRWVIEGLERFHETMARGRGLVLVTGHFGNWEYGVSRLGLEGCPIVAPAERMRPEPLFQLFCRLRAHHGARLLPADSRDTLRQLVEALKRNEVVAFLADRYVTGSSVEVPFFGEPARLPTAPMALALRHGAPVLAIFSWRAPGGWSHGEIVPLDVRAAEGEGAGSAASAVRVRSGVPTERAMRVYVRALEERITAHPEQWVAALARIWDD